jgi:hypothetical protein
LKIESHRTATQAATRAVPVPRFGTLRFKYSGDVGAARLLAGEIGDRVLSFGMSVLSGFAARTGNSLKIYAQIKSID